jgi:hypothetical protein
MTIPTAKKDFAYRLRKLKKMAQFLPIKQGVSNWENAYLSYQPDSHHHFQQHPEFLGLYAKFVAQNVKNNGGDIGRLWSLMLNCKQVAHDSIAGDFAEVGVWRGNTAATLAHYAGKFGRRAHLFDTFEGFDARDLHGVDSKWETKHFSDTSVELVQEMLGGDAMHCDLVKGYFPQSVRVEDTDARYALVSLDCDLYEPMRAGLDFFYPRMTRGGTFMLHDYSSGFWEGAKRAVDEFCLARGEFVMLLPDKSGSAVIRKSGASPLPAM